MTPQNFVKERPYVIWYAKDRKRLSDAAIVESVLNQGDFDDVKKLISLMGIKKIAKIFREQTRRKRVNYDPKIRHYFRLYFKQHA